MIVVIKTRYIHDEVADTDGNARTTVKVQQVGLAWHYGPLRFRWRKHYNTHNNIYDDISNNAGDTHLSHL